MTSTSQSGQHLTMIGQDTVQPTESVCNLGYYMDKELKGRAHISKLCSTLYLAIKKIARIRCMIDKDTTAIIMQALILSRLDYCNSLLLGCANYKLSLLQKIQNMASKVVNHTTTYDKVSRDIRSLHWLKVREHIIYKIACLMFQCYTNQAPEYLSSLVIKPHSRQIRSAELNKLPLSDAWTTHCQNCFFTIWGPCIWNDLPSRLRYEPT